MGLNVNRKVELTKLLTGLENRVLFEDMPTIWHAQKVLYSGTHLR
jgi:hypothetical protein